MDEKSTQICTLIQNNANWRAPSVPAGIEHGDMPGDKVNISKEHIQKAEVIFPVLLGELKEVFSFGGTARAVVTVCGGSGVGKSETASILSYYLREIGIGAYTLSGDNYPHRIPRENDAERLRVFRVGGVRGLLTSGLYSKERAEMLEKLQCAEKDADVSAAKEHPWLAVYQREGQKALKGYLGTAQEQNFDELTEAVSRFKNGADAIWLKRMGREGTELWYDKVDFTNINVLMIEWTHGNSDAYQGADIPILLNSTPQETAAYRKLRNRDGKTDSPFTTMVLQLEQEKLEAQAHKAKIIMAKSGEIIDYRTYRRIMAEE